MPTLWDEHSGPDRIHELEAVNRALVEALEGTLSWLTSYPGSGANRAYDKARAALELARKTP